MQYKRFSWFSRKRNKPTDRRTDMTSFVFIDMRIREKTVFVEKRDTDQWTNCPTKK